MAETTKQTPEQAIEQTSVQVSEQTYVQVRQAYDVIIVGGGLSGLLSAVALTQQQSSARALKIAIVEANAISPTQTNSFDDRVIALSHGSVAYFKQLNVWAAMACDATAIENIHISDRGNYGKARINAQDHQVEALGYVVPLASIANALLNALNNTTNIDWYAPEIIQQISFHQSHVDIALSEDKLLQAKLVMACDGGQSLCRKAANIGTTSNDYQQCAVIANVETQRCHQHWAYERFTENGPIAMLPMQGQQCSLVWTLRPEQADNIASLSDTEFCYALEQAFGTWLGKIEKTSRRSIFPLALVKAGTQTYHRLALVGNASHTIHPIAGQGFNLGLRDVQSLALLVAKASDEGLDIGSGKLLNQYQQQREKDQSEIIGLTDTMVKLFSNDLSPISTSRNIGLKVMNYLSPLQSAFVNKTMGY